MTRNINDLDPNEIGRRVLAARSGPHTVRWKVLQRRFGYCKTRLWMLMKEAEKTDKCVHEHFSAGQKIETNLLTGKTLNS